MGQQMSHAGVEVIDGLLHGLHSEPQRLVISLQHGVLLVHVAVTL